MKNILFSILMLTYFGSLSQNLTKKGEVFPDRAFEDCEGNIYSVYDMLADGKPLVIFCSTVDCGYCFEEAPAVSADILKYKDRINFVFALTPHNTYPRCSGTGAGDHDWPDDWKNRYPGYKEIPITVQPAGDNFLQPICPVTTAFGMIDPNTKKLVDGGCRAEGRKLAIDAALRMYTEGTITLLSSTVSKPTITSTGTVNSRTISLASTTQGAEIYYTLNGNTPSMQSLKYNGPIQISHSTLVKAIAFKNGSNNSGVKASMVKVDNHLLNNIASEAIGYEWVRLLDPKSNLNARPLVGVNDGKLIDVKLNGGQNDDKNAYQAVGVIWDSPKTGITSMKLTHYTPTADGWGSKDFFGYDMRIQSTTDGNTWVDLMEVGHYPEYPYAGNQKRANTEPTIFFTDKPITAKGIRVVGQVHIDGPNWSGMTSAYAGLKEFEVFANTNLTSYESFDISQGVLVYPNPAKGVLKLQLKENAYNILSIADVAGKIVLSQTIQNSKETLDVSSLPKGLYILTLKGEETYRKQIVIE